MKTTLLYERHFAAVGGDAMAFECWPPRTSVRGKGEEESWCLHEWLVTVFFLMLRSFDGS